MNPARKLVYGFISLPYHEQLKLLKGLYTPEEFEELKDTDLFVAAFRRANEQGKLKDLMLRIKISVAEIEDWRTI